VYASLFNVVVYYICSVLYYYIFFIFIFFHDFVLGHSSSRLPDVCLQVGDRSLSVSSSTHASPLTTPSSSHSSLPRGEGRDITPGGRLVPAYIESTPHVNGHSGSTEDNSGLILGADNTLPPYTADRARGTSTVAFFDNVCYKTIMLFV